MSTVALEWRCLRPAPAAELLREPLKEALIPRAQLSKLRKAFDHILLMAGGKSDYLESAIVDEVLGATAFAAPTPVFFALWTTAAATDMDAYHGGTAGEVSGGSYDRVSVTNNVTNFPSAHPKLNGTAITFPTATANWNAGANIPQMGVFDANAKTSGDNLLLWSDLTTAKPVLNGDTAQFAINAFSWTEN